METISLSIVDMRPDGLALNRGGRRLPTFAVVVADIRLQG